MSKTIDADMLALLEARREEVNQILELRTRYPLGNDPAANNRWHAINTRWNAMVEEVVEVMKGHPEMLT